MRGIAHNTDGDQTSITGPSPRGTVTLGYDGRHLATSQTANSVTTNWLIDGEARVTKQTKGAAETRYRYITPGDAPAWEENSSGTITASFVQGPLGVLATNTSGTMSYPVYNGHGDVIQTSDSADKFNYDEYGDVVSTAKPARYGYVGKWQKDREEDSSLIRMGVRMYDPLVGRFASWDPVDGGDYNAYTYAGQDPINSLDLTGMRRADDDTYRTSPRGGERQYCGKPCDPPSSQPKRKKSGKKTCSVRCWVNGANEVGTSIGEAFQDDNWELYIDGASVVAFTVCAPFGYAVPCATATQIVGRVGVIIGGGVRGLWRAISGERPGRSR